MTTEKSSDERVPDEEEYRISFWKKLQEARHTYIPENVKNILRFNHMDNPTSFTCLNDDTIEELEKFAREDMKHLIEESTPDLKKYYGHYHKKPENFRFTIGEKFMLKKMVEFVKISKDEYWKDTHQIESTPTNEPQENSVVCLEFNEKNEDDKLRKRISDTVESLKEVLSEDIFSLFNKGKINLSIESDIAGAQYIAKMKCPVCQTVNKMTRKNNPKSFWNLSNLRRHISRHGSENDHGHQAIQPITNPNETDGIVSQTAPDINDVTKTYHDLQPGVDSPNFVNSDPISPIGQAVHALTSIGNILEDRSGE